MEFFALRPAPGTVQQHRASGAWRTESPLADLRRWRDETPEAIAVVAHRTEDGSLRELTYRQLAYHVEVFAEALVELGVGPGQAVVVQLPNWWQVGALYLACARVGAVVAPVMMTLGPRELERVLARLEAGVCITAREWAGVDHAAVVAEMAPRLPKLRHHVVLGPDGAPEGAIDFTAFFERPDRAGVVVDAPAEDPDRVAMVLFTSGTTGEPKGILHTANTLYAGTGAVSAAEGYGPGDIFYATQAVTHIFGTMVNILMPLLAGGTAVLADRFEAEPVLDLIARTGVNILAGAPTFVAELLELAERDGAPELSLRQVLSGATTVPGPLIEGVPRAWGVQLRTAWGMTEVPGICWVRQDDPPLWGLHSDGRPGPGLELDFRTEDGAEPTQEQPASLFVRGAGVALGSFGRDSGELRVFADLDGGWYDTGDLAVPDGRGGLRISGRSADRIGGSLMIPVADVETELLAHPGVKDVALVGYKLREDDELACAVVVPQGEAPTLDGLRAFLTSRGMTDWYQPSRLELVSELPRNAIGKVLKHLLRDQLRTGQVENLLAD